MKLEKYFKNVKIDVWKGKYAVIKSKKKFPAAFANIQDKKEITSIVKQTEAEKKHINNIERNFRIITFDTVLPFEIVGFLAKISKALAKKNISIFVISAFSTDHILVKEKDLKKTINELKKLGFVIKNEQKN